MRTFKGPNLATTMGKVGGLLLVFMLFTMPFPGCISSINENSSIDLEVDLPVNNGTIVETYVDGALSSTQNVVFTFDFSGTTATNQIVTYGIDLRNGDEPVLVDAATTSSVEVSFNDHGVYAVDAFAIDEADVRANMTVSIRIEFRMEWTETNTNDPLPLVFDPAAGNQGEDPIMIEVHSTVENPSLVSQIGGGGQTVAFTWSIVDDQNEACQSRSGQAEDGGSDSWNTAHFNTYGIHELRVQYEDGQDYINVEHSLSILYKS